MLTIAPTNSSGHSEDGAPATELSGDLQSFLTFDRLFEAGRGIGVATLAGIPAGFLAAGVGSRLAMRASGFMFARDHPNRLAFAESGARVGEITAGGTMFLLIFGTLLGVMGAYFYAVTKPWLPGGAVVRGLLFGLVSLVLLSPLSLDPGNDDFQRLGSVGVNVFLFAALFFAYGMLIAPIDGWLDRALPRQVEFSRQGLSPKSVVASTALIGGIITGLLMIQITITFLGVALIGAEGTVERLQIGLVLAAAFILLPAYLIFLRTIRENGYRAAYRRWPAPVLVVCGGAAVILIASAVATTYAIVTILNT